MAASASSSSSYADADADADAARVCVRCEKDDSNYLDAGARMWVSSCGHALCQRCKDELYLRHRVNTCAAKNCGVTLTLSAADFSAQTREQREYEEEKRQRRRLAAVYNRSQAEFGGDEAAHAAYCERVELLAMRLVAGSERERAMAEAEVAAYRASHAADILRSAAQADARARAEQQRLQAEAAAREAAARAAATAEATARRATERVRRHVTDVVVLGERLRQAAAAEEEGATRAGAGPRAGAARVAASSGSDEAEDEGASLRNAKRRLLELQARRRAEAEAAARSGLGEAAARMAAEAMQALFPPGHPVFVACPEVWPPRLVSAPHLAWLQLAPAALPLDSLARHRRAALGVCGGAGAGSKRSR